ncbi:MAG: hypothetical protein EA390_01040, partial [Balneolaceae bacterium]
NLRFCFVVLPGSMRRFWVDGHRTRGVATGCDISRFQRLDPGRFYIYAHNQKLSGIPNTEGV